MRDVLKLQTTSRDSVSVCVHSAIEKTASAVIAAISGCQQIRKWEIEEKIIIKNCVVSRFVF